MIPIATFALCFCFVASFCCSVVIRRPASGGRSLSRCSALSRAACRVPCFSRTNEATQSDEETTISPDGTSSLGVVSVRGEGKVASFEKKCTSSI